MSLRIAIVALTLSSACHKAEQAPPPPPAKPALAHASAADLGHELDTANRLGTWREIQDRWQGQRLTWTVTRQKALCGAPDSCNVAPFPISRPAPHGWMPQLDFAPGQFAALDAACGAAEQCDLTFEGILATLDVSPAMPTNLTFANVRVVRAAPHHS